MFRTMLGDGSQTTADGWPNGSARSCEKPRRSRIPDRSLLKNWPPARVKYDVRAVQMMGQELARLIAPLLPPPNSRQRRRTVCVDSRAANVLPHQPILTSYTPIRSSVLRGQPLFLPKLQSDMTSFSKPYVGRKTIGGSRRGRIRCGRGLVVRIGFG
jgi:hypothetical protein